jgi:hypothetical protein
MVYNLKEDKNKIIKKKILMFFIDRFEEKEYMNGIIMKRSYKINNGKRLYFKMQMGLVFSSW